MTVVGVVTVVLVVFFGMVFGGHLIEIGKQLGRLAAAVEAQNSHYGVGVEDKTNG